MQKGDRVVGVELCTLSSAQLLVTVARSSLARASRPLYFTDVFFYFLSFFSFSYRTFSDVGKPTSPKLSHMTWLSVQQNLYYTDFFEVPPKTNGAEKLKIWIIFRAKSRTISAVIL